MADHTVSEYVGFKKSNVKDLADKTNQRRVLMLEETVHELIEKMEKMERSMHVMVKQNIMMKNRLDELNGKQKDTHIHTHTHTHAHAHVHAHTNLQFFL